VTTVTLTPKQIEYADDVARKRRASAIAHGRPGKNKLSLASEDEYVDLDIVGARCELAGWLYFKPIKSYLNIFDKISGLPDLGDCIEVKGSKHPHPTLIVNPLMDGSKPPLDWAYLLIRAYHHPVYELLGWRWGWEFLDDEHWNTLKDKSRPAWRATPPYRPISEMMALVRSGRLDLKLPRLDMEPDEFIEAERRRAISAWIERHWPKDKEGGSYGSLCRHCGAKAEPPTHLIPVGYGQRPKLWMHWACYGPYWAGVRLRALRETGWD
jgi:hypothetical protein